MGSSQQVQKFSGRDCHAAVAISVQAKSREPAQPGQRHSIAGIKRTVQLAISRLAVAVSSTASFLPALCTGRRRAQAGRSKRKFNAVPCVNL